MNHNLRAQYLSRVQDLQEEVLRYVGLSPNEKLQRLAIGMTALLEGGLLGEEPPTDVTLEEMRKVGVSRPTGTTLLTLREQLGGDLTWAVQQEQPFSSWESALWTPICDTMLDEVKGTGEEDVALLEAGQAFPGAECANTPLDDFTQELAAEHAKYMASRRKGGHQYFDQRFDSLLREYGSDIKVSEICAQSWPWEKDDLQKAGLSQWKAWKYSPGHWRTASRLHTGMGINMERGRNGIWYACVLVWRRDPKEEAQ